MSYSKAVEAQGPAKPASGQIAQQMRTLDIAKENQPASIGNISRLEYP